MNTAVNYMRLSRIVVSNSLLREQEEMVHDVVGLFIEIKQNHDGYTIYHQDLEAVLKQATAIDRDICRQVAHLTWDFGNDEIPFSFNKEAMMLDREEQPSLSDGRVTSVIAPAMSKTGKSSGDEYDKPRQLLVPMKVTGKLV